MPLLAIGQGGCARLGRGRWSSSHHLDNGSQIAIMCTESGNIQYVYLSNRLCSLSYSCMSLDSAVNLPTSHSSQLLASPPADSKADAWATVGIRTRLIGRVFGRILTRHSQTTSALFRTSSAVHHDCRLGPLLRQHAATRPSCKREVHQTRADNHAANKSSALS